MLGGRKRERGLPNITIQAFRLLPNVPAVRFETLRLICVRCVERDNANIAVAARLAAAAASWIFTGNGSVHTTFTEMLTKSSYASDIISPIDDGVIRGIQL